MPVIADFNTNNTRNYVNFQDMKENTPYRSDSLGWTDILVFKLSQLTTDDSKGVLWYVDKQGNLGPVIYMNTTHKDVKFYTVLGDKIIFKAES